MSDSLATRPFVLIGARGCGKTTVALALGKLLQCEAIDLDQVIVKTAGKNIREIFSTEGEAAFRELETQALRDALAKESPPRATRVISAGGGAVLAEENQQMLRDHAAAVWLQAEVATMLSRIQQDATTVHNRPPLTDLDAEAELRQLLAQRTPIYQSVANLIINTDHKSPEVIAEEIINWRTGMEN